MRVGTTKVIGHSGMTTDADSWESHRLIFKKLLLNASMYSDSCRISISCTSFTIDCARSTGIANLGIEIKKLLMEVIPELLLNLAWVHFKVVLKVAWLSAFANMSLTMAIGIL